MKKVLLLFVLLFPYIMLLEMAWAFVGCPEEMFMQRLMVSMLLISALFTVELIIVSLMAFFAVTRRWTISEVMQANMIIKLAHFFTHIVVAAASVHLLLSDRAFSAILAGLVISVALFAIMLSAVVGVAGIVRLCMDKKISISYAIINGNFQFLFGFDVISSVLLYRNVKSDDSARAL